MIYLDSSALLKLLFEEEESAALAGWISERSDTPMVSSELAKVEVVRAARRIAERAAPAARALVAQVDLIPLSGVLIERAMDEGEASLRTLDAIHLASALSVRSELTAFVAYDLRLIAAAEVSGIETTRPSSAG